MMSNYAKTNNEKLFGLKIHEHLLAGILKQNNIQKIQEQYKKQLLSAK